MTVPIYVKVPEHRLQRNIQGQEKGELKGASEPMSLFSPASPAHNAASVLCSVPQMWHLRWLPSKALEKHCLTGPCSQLPLASRPLTSTIFSMCSATKAWSSLGLATEVHSSSTGGRGGGVQLVGLVGCGNGQV